MCTYTFLYAYEKLSTYPEISLQNMRQVSVKMQVQTEQNTVSTHFQSTSKTPRHIKKQTKPLPSRGATLINH